MAVQDAGGVQDVAARWPHGWPIHPAFDRLTPEQAEKVYEAEEMVSEAWDLMVEATDEQTATEFLRDRILFSHALHGLTNPRPHRRRQASIRIRTRLMERHGWCCRRCGSHEDLVLDHDMPVAWGGSSREWNLVVLCDDCNSKKGANWP